MLEAGYKEQDYLRGIDWEKTRAYAVGLGGIYINLKNRERAGIVDKSEVASLKNELIEKLKNLTDPKNGSKGVSDVTDVATAMKGPYRFDGPELLVGFAEGYRVSWDCARGVVTAEIFEDNTKSWSGDHCMDPKVVPGILFSNMKIAHGDPMLMDMAPTVLDLFGIRAPAHMVGKTLVTTP